ncbi:MAG: corrinoid protein [Thermoguttaceae bacterium]|nr:corrinoid protein [Thermoguttaceae bacterium]
MSEPTRTELYEAIVEGDVASAADATQTLIDAGLSADEILDGSVVPAMDEVGRLFDEGEYFVPELLMASKATQLAMGVLDPLMKSAGVEKIGCVVIGTVKGDMHDIGKNLVAAMLEGAGFEVIDLGVNVAPEKFVEAVKARGGAKTFVALSALLTTTTPQMKATIELLEKEGLAETTKTLVGGAPVTAEFAASIGADGYSDGANACVALAKRLLAEWNDAV